MAGLKDIYDNHRGKVFAGLVGATLLAGCATHRGDQSYERDYPPQPPTATGAVRDTINEAFGCPPENDSCANAAAVNLGRGINLGRLILNR